MNFEPIEIIIHKRIADELMPLYQEDKDLRSRLGLYDMTFEEWYKNMLTIGSLHTIKRNARVINDSHIMMLEEEK